MARSQKHPLIIAHRGASAHAPENTFAAFQKAIEVGADGIEFDVRLARDGVPVVIHDETLKRTARRAGRISEMTSGELAAVDVGSWFNAAFPTRARPDFAVEKIKTLRQTLEFLADFRGRVYIELKYTESDLESLSLAVCESIGESPLLPQIIVKSFALAAVPLIRKYCPSARTAALFEPTVQSVLRKRKHIIDMAVEVGADELSIHRALATGRLARLAADRNMPVAVWTVDGPSWLNRKFQALITNDPTRMIEYGNR